MEEGFRQSLKLTFLCKPFGMPITALLGGFFMLKIKSLFLRNYAGFQDPCLFDFTRADGSFKPVNMFFGPNGCGKSTGLNAIGLLGRSKLMQKETLVTIMFYSESFNITQTTIQAMRDSLSFRTRWKLRAFSMMVKKIS